MARMYYLGRFAKTTAEPSEVLADAEVLTDHGVLPKDQSRIAARIDSHKGVVLTRPTENRPWQVWQVDLQTPFASELEAVVEASYRMKAKPIDGEKPPLWSPFLWPA